MTLRKMRYHVVMGILGQSGWLCQGPAALLLCWRNCSPHRSTHGPLPCLTGYAPSKRTVSMKSPSEDTTTRSNTRTVVVTTHHSAKRCLGKGLLDLLPGTDTVTPQA